MSGNLKVGIGFVGGGILTIVGILQLASLPSAPFNYDSASPDERRSFLASEAKPIEKALKRALISSSGVGASMYLQTTEIDTESREIRYVINVNGRLASGEKVEAAEMALYKMICPRYVGSRLGRSDVRVVPSFVRRERRSESVLLELPISVSACNRYL